MSPGISPMPWQKRTVCAVEVCNAKDVGSTALRGGSSASADGNLAGVKLLRSGEREGGSSQECDDGELHDEGFWFGFLKNG